MLLSSTSAPLNEDEQELVRAAFAASSYAYAPYSGFAVGAAVRTRSDSIYVGSNMENASYGLAVCAEVAALTASNTAGDFTPVQLAVAGRRILGPADSQTVVTPCGRCRQLICEAAHVSGVDIAVLSCSGDLSTVVKYRITELLPQAFGPANVGADTWAEMREVLMTQARRDNVGGGTPSSADRWRDSAP